MNIKKQDILFVSLFLALAAALYFSFEPYETEINQFNAPEVYTQPYLALTKSFEKVDEKVEVLEDANDMFGLDITTAVIPDPNDVIFIDKGEIVISNSLANSFLTWIDNGGHLVMGLSANEGESSFSANHLLKQLGVETVAAISDDFEEFTGNTIINTDEFGEIEIFLTTSVYINTELEDDIYYSAFPFGENEDDYDLNYGYPTFLQINYGEGLVTLLTNGNIWKNFQLDSNDNVLLAHAILGDAKTIYILEYDTPQMWYELIYFYSPAFYWSLLLLIAITLWYSAVRFGAIKQLDTVVVTYFSEHIRAAGEFYWSSGQRAKMLSEVRTQLLEEASSRVATNNPTTESLLAFLAKISMWPEDTIHELVLSDQSNINQANFIKLMQGLQQLRKMI